jgi:hypothetical protein
VAKYDPIISEFESEEAEQAYDLWFRAQVEAGMAYTGPCIPHAEVVASTEAILKKHRDARSDLAA